MSGSGKGGGGPVRVGEVLSSLGTRLGITGAARAGRLWERWAEVVGDAVAAHAEPTSLREGVLRVRTDSPAWATEVGYLAPEIARRANELLGTKAVSEVRIWTAPGPITRVVSARGAAPVRSRSDHPEDAPADPPENPMEALERARRAWSRRRGRRDREGR